MAGTEGYTDFTLSSIIGSEDHFLPVHFQWCMAPLLQVLVCKKASPPQVHLTTPPTSANHMSGALVT